MMRGIRCFAAQRGNRNPNLRRCNRACWGGKRTIRGFLRSVQTSGACALVAGLSPRTLVFMYRILSLRVFAAMLFCCVSRGMVHAHFDEAAVPLGKELVGGRYDGRHPHPLVLGCARLRVVGCSSLIFVFVFALWIFTRSLHK